MRPKQNGRHFPDDIFKWIFLYDSIYISIKISLKFVPQGPINNIPGLVQIMAWRLTGDKSLSETILAFVGDAYMRHSASMKPCWWRGPVMSVDYLLLWNNLTMMKVFVYHRLKFIWTQLILFMGWNRCVDAGCMNSSKTGKYFHIYVTIKQVDESIFVSAGVVIGVGMWLISLFTAKENEITHALQ